SKEDAEQWKKKLQRLNIQKAYISEQKIRDVLWYRVRFGEFPTKETAIQAAKQLGFSQMWIDRVK
ncbi:SPOR domain-containing protein, partial [bacterium]|nr:SPOR domain-containing protein [bacterium]